MTISTVYSPDTYSGNGVLDTYAITFPFLSVSTNVKVSIKVNSTGVITTKTASTHYDVTGSNVVFTAGNIPASGETVIIELSPDFKQTSDYAENSAFPAETLETDLDERCLESQINKDQISRAIKVDSSVDLTSFTPTIEATSYTANYLLQVNSDADGFSLVAPSNVSVSGSLSGSTGIVAETSAGVYAARTITGTANQISVANGTGASANPTLSLPSDVDITSSLTIGGNATASGYIELLEDSDNGSNKVIITPASSLAADYTLTLPSATDTLVGKTTTDTLTNKTLTAPVITQIVSTGNDDIDISPAGTGNVTLGTVTLDGDMTVGAGQDNYVLKYDDGTGLVSLEAEAAGGISNVVDDTTPQLGGSLDVNGNKIVSTSNGDIDIEPNGTGNVLIGNLTIDADQTVGAGQDDYVLTYDNGTGLVSLEAAAGGFTAATQAEQETGTSTTVGVTPGRQHYHTSAAKAWATIDCTGTVTISDSYNITSIADIGVGNIDVTIATNFSSVNYSAIATVEDASVSTAAQVSIQAGSRTAGFLSFDIWTGNVGARHDPERLNVVMFGDQ